MGARAKEAEGVQVAFEVSPFAEGLEYAFAVKVGAVVNSIVDYGGGAAGSRGFRGSQMSPLLE